MRDTTQLYLSVIVSEDKPIDGLALDSWAELEPLVDRYLDTYSEELQAVVGGGPLVTAERQTIKAFLEWTTKAGHARQGDVPSVPDAS